MRKIKNRKALIIILSAVMLFSLLACAAADVPENAVISTAPAPDTAEEAPEASSVHERLEKLRETLPELPDVDIHSWEFQIANSYNSITGYAPPYGNVYGQGIDRRIADAVSSFIGDAREQGYDVYIYAGIRNNDYQYYHFMSAVEQYGSAWEAAKHIEPPSTSEHQTGLCIDVTSNINFAGLYDDVDNSSFLETDAYKWMAEHCQEYGFIVRYPEGTEKYSGFCCHNGHFRYVGLDAAAYIMENNLCLEEFISLYDEDAIYIPEK